MVDVDGIKILNKELLMYNQKEMTDIELNNVNPAQHPQYQPMPGQTPMQQNPYNQPQQFSPNPHNQPPPQQMAPNPYNTGAFGQINQGVANGFGPMFFNLRDPNFTQKNDPIKQPPSWHIPVVVGNILLIGWLVTAIIGFQTFLGVGVAFGVLGGIYVIYLCLVCCTSDIKDYIHNMKPFDRYQDVYDKMVKGQGYFKFWIQCYHYQTYHDRNGSHTRKVVTHTATEIFNVRQCLDESGEIQSIQDITSHVFIHYLKRYYFNDDASEQTFIAAFNSFVSRNTSDSHQNYSHNFDIRGFEEFVSFSALGDGSKSMAMFYIFLFTGLAMPFACIFQRTVSRYDVGILKRLTV